MPEFIDAHGIAIVYDVHPAKTEPRAVVQLLHGVGEHAGRYSALIAALTADGYTVYAADHRGHGRTGMGQHRGDVSRLGHLGPGGLRAALATMWQFSEQLRAEHSTLPLVLLGHSGGSVLAQMLVNLHPDAYDGLVLTGSALRMPGSIRTSGLNRPWDGPDATGTEWLSSDLTVGRAFLDDPLTTSEDPIKLIGVVDSLRMYGRPRRNLGRDIPTLLMVGRDDTVGGPRSVHRLADAYRTRSGFTDVTTLVYPGARHEIFNEVMQADVRGDLLAWLDQRFPVRV
ncbi:alpha/beta fold hydrolase [Microbacterium flavescens]|jgi:alpha-beta hydrolase superfamily lysophospholipase|uniref:alpha/beta fold hydrolase n=1 Tax=Microbacterium flavescens TaxID=69366 RepID=UPI001BDEB60A|nr:alpha/beta fold hydrolase [Microbacterium flavescens]